MSNLLRLPIAPTRAGILKEVARLNLPETASESARVLYKLLENNFAPLRLSQQVDEQLAIINSTANQQYVEAIRNVAATKSLKQVLLIVYSVIIHLDSYNLWLNFLDETSEDYSVLF